MQEFLNADCMDVMKEYPDDFFDLAIVDPPYGDGNAEYDAKNQRNGGRFSPYTKIKDKNPRFKNDKVVRSGRGWARGYGDNIVDWDVAPNDEYFAELFRVSKNQIIWGGNYFNLPKTRCFIVWEKTQIPENFSMAMCEYAWASFNDNAKIVKLSSIGKKDDPRFHPTQKPVALYTWLLNRYAKKGDKILDTHVGSGSSLIACRRLGFDYVGTEIDETYYKKACERIERETAQATIFNYLGGENGT